MYGVHATYYMDGAYNEESDRIIAIYSTRREAEIEIERLYAERQWDEHTIILKHGEWASPSYKIVGVNEQTAAARERAARGEYPARRHR